MKINLRPSLEHIALVKIVVTLWSQVSIRSMINALRRFYPYRTENLKWKKIENRVTEKVSHLPLPELLKEKISDFVKPTGFEISKWIRYHCLVCNLHLDLKVEFCWTPQGTIDRKKTAEVIIKDDNVDICVRYRLACMYCMEEDILNLRKNLPKGEATLHQDDMVQYWNNPNKDWRQDPLWQNNDISFYQWKFETVAERGNKAATYYFFQKLTPRERDDCLANHTIAFLDPEILIFLLSHMNEEQQSDFFKYGGSKVLVRFLNWPFQSLFLEIASHMMDFLSGKDIQSLLKYFVNKERKGYRDCNYKKIFGDFLQKSCSAIKSHIISYFTDIDNSLDLFFLKNEKNLKLLLQDASLIEKEKFIYGQKWKKHIFKQWIYEEEWDLLGLLIQKCLPSKDKMLKFKEDIEGCRHSISNCLAKNKHKWDKLFALPEEPSCNFNKRECIPNEGNMAKRICCTQTDKM